MHNILEIFFKIINEFMKPYNYTRISINHPLDHTRNRDIKPQNNSIHALSVGNISFSYRTHSSLCNLNLILTGNYLVSLCKNCFKYTCLRSFYYNWIKPIGSIVLILSEIGFHCSLFFHFISQFIFVHFS